MITFKESQELFADEVIVTANCKFLPDCFKMPARVKNTMVEAYKMKIEKQCLVMLTEKMFNQRLQNYNHSGTQNGYQFIELQKGRENLELIKNADYGKFIQTYKDKIYRVLLVVIPPLDSPLYDTYNEKTKEIETFLKSKKS